MEPYEWWPFYGAHAPMLPNIALKLLANLHLLPREIRALIHFLNSMRRNKMAPERVENLVFSEVGKEIRLGYASSLVVVDNLREK